MHVIKAINKAFEDGKMHTAKDKDGNRYEVYISQSDTDQKLRVLKNGMMIEISLDLDFKGGLSL